MEIKRNGSQPSGKGPADWFTGAVRIDPLFQANAPARASAASVTFEPGARTAWHTHPLGQTLIVTAGCGWAQREGGPIEEIRPGEIVWFPPGEKHWHGDGPFRRGSGGVLFVANPNTITTTKAINRFRRSP
jgi:quercetin dioxygenase-like cupin family protein